MCNADELYEKIVTIYDNFHDEQMKSGHNNWLPYVHAIQMEYPRYVNYRESRRSCRKHSYESRA